MSGIRADWTTMAVFLAAVELGSIAKGAQRCGIAHSAAAKRLRLLDSDCGTPLLARGARGVTTTATGEAMVLHARTMLDLSDHISEELRDIVAGGKGKVRLRATASIIAGDALGPSLAAFQQHHPGIRLQVREETSAAVLRDLADARGDLGLITMPGDVPAPLDVLPWRTDRLMLVAPQSHPLATRKSVRFAEALDHPLVEVQGGGALSLLLGEQAWRLGRSIDTAAEVTSADAARRLVAAGLGICVMPEGLCHGKSGGTALTAVPLNERWAQRALRLVSRPAALLPLAARLLRTHLLLEHA